MDKTLFITHEFSEKILQAGDFLIQQLDEKKSKIDLAFWLLDTEENSWKLMIVSPLIETEGPKCYYKRINEINKTITSNNIISLHDIEIINKDNRFAKALLEVKNSALWSDKYWKNTRLGKNFLGQVYFEDMYIYRIEEH